MSKRFSCSIAMIMLIGGCIGGCAAPRGPSLSFRAVDASTNLPLTGVTVHQQSVRPPYIFDRGLNRTFQYGPTSSDGTIITEKTYRNAQNLFFFRRIGYTDAHASYDPDLGVVGIFSPPPGEGILPDYPLKAMPGEIITIPMSPEKASRDITALPTR